MSRLIKIGEWSGEKRGNAVFVHGLGGHPYDTWRRARVDGAFWPAWLAEDVKGLSVFSLGYVSPPTNWLGTAMPLLDEAANVLRLLLNHADLREGPIAFVCHSLGGLVVKQVLRAANEQRGDPAIADLLDRTRQVVFLATPHTGSRKATLLERLGFLAWGSDSVRDLVANNPVLRDLNIGYRVVREEAFPRHASAHRTARRGAAGSAAATPRRPMRRRRLRSAAEIQAQSSLSQASRRRRLWPAAASTALIASPTLPAR